MIIIVASTCPVLTCAGALPALERFGYVSTAESVLAPSSLFDSSPFSFPWAFYAAFSYEIERCAVMAVDGRVSMLGPRCRCLMMLDNAVYG